MEAESADGSNLAARRVFPRLPLLLSHLLTLHFRATILAVFASELSSLPSYQLWGPDQGRLSGSKRCATLMKPWTAFPASVSFRGFFEVLPSSLQHAERRWARSFKLTGKQHSKGCFQYRDEPFPRSSLRELVFPFLSFSIHLISQVHRTPSLAYPFTYHCQTHTILSSPLQPPVRIFFITIAQTAQSR